MARKLPSRPPFRQAEISLPDWLRGRILHLGPDVLVLDKPAGLPVSARNGESLERWLPSLRLGKRRDPQPAHRLDADTAGCLVLGRTAPMLARLNAAFAERRVGKLYWAVVRGHPPQASGTVEASLRKVSSADRGWRMEVHGAGDPARTAWSVLGHGDGLSWLALLPETGRTHQLRVHCTFLAARSSAMPSTAAGRGGCTCSRARSRCPWTPNSASRRQCRPHAPRACRLRWLRGARRRISAPAAPPAPPRHPHRAR
jgi:23S rRNA-/tRNA-specific pseudouridylate synthase